MRSLYLTIAAALCFAAAPGPPTLNAIFYEPVGEVGGGPECDAGDDFCAHFEGNSTASTCDSATESTPNEATVESGTRDCDVAGTGSTPEGSEVARLGTGTPNHRVGWETDVWDSGDTEDVTYGRFCLQVTDTNTGTQAFLQFVDGTSGIGAFGQAALWMEADGTPRVQAHCASSGSEPESAWIDITEDTWHEINFSYDDSTGGAEICVDAPTGDAACESCTGSDPSQNFDGANFYMLFSSVAYEVDVFRVEAGGSGFGDVVGCD